MKVKAYIVGVLTLVTISAAIYFCFSFENRTSSDSLNGEVNSYDVNTSDKDHVFAMTTASAQKFESTNESVKGEKNMSKEWNLRLVNSDNPLGMDYQPELKSVRGDLQMEARAAEYMLRMVEDAKKDGVSLLICSAYRSVARQEVLYNNKVDYYLNKGFSKDEAKVRAAQVVAAPGTSEHNLGLAADIVTPSYQMLDEGFEKTDACKWLKANAYKYGFILRYPKDKFEKTKVIYEPWHYRFVGVDHAKAIYESGLCLEEYLEAL